MKYLILCASLVTALLLSSPATASPLDDKVTALKKAIKEEIAAKASTSPNAPQSQAYLNSGYLVAGLDQILSQIDNPNVGNNAEMQISQLLASFTSDAVQKAGRDLIDEIRQERKARADAAAAEIQALVKRVSDEVPKAKKPEDLDGLLVDLQKFQNERNGGYNPENQALYQQVGSAFEFTKLWQNYLSHLATGQPQLATNDLQNLSQNNYAVGIIPRSQILELLAGLTTPGKGTAGGTAAPPSAIENIFQGIKTLDDMEPALQQLSPLRQNDQQAQMAYARLEPLVQTYTNVKAGLPTNMNLNFGAYNGYNSGPSVSSALQAQLLVFILQHYFDSYQGTPPAPDEKPLAFVKRVIADAVSREDWPLLKKAITEQSYLNRSIESGVYTTGTDSTGIDNLLAASHQEAAGQYALAVVSYRTALRGSEADLPAKLIGDKLAAIQKNHPQEYDEAMRIAISSPGQRYFPGYPLPQINTGLSIPGATTNPPPATPAPPSTNAAPAK